MTRCVIVTGPTASGKTRLAVALARRFGGEIVSADSRQVYRGMDIGTGKDMEEYSGSSGAVACHLIDVVAADEDFHLFRYLELAGDAIAA
ncbi:MAG TPA: isopentenyl transferase family protein, partial [Lentisphaeria bacterium]|nr:isopentenyl transferase family protein [Lentisphaeria bacterium]